MGKTRPNHHLANITLKTLIPLPELFESRDFWRFSGSREGARYDSLWLSDSGGWMVKCTKKQIRQLKTALRWKIPAAQRERMQMVLLRESGMTQPAIAEAMGVSLSTVNRPSPPRSRAASFRSRAAAPSA